MTTNGAEAGTGARGGPLVGSTSRRTVLRWIGQGGLGIVLAGPARAALGTASFRAAAGAPATPGAGVVDRLVIDQVVEPPTLDPALVYDANGWSVVHSVYDALVQYGADGQLEPLLAESVSLIDPVTYEIRLRRGVTFHNGEPFDARSVAFSVAHLLDPKTASQVAQNFKVIDDVQTVDPYTVRLALTEPAPWLPAQMAPWLAMLPPGYAADPANDIGARPVGTGPYRFVEWRRGDHLTLDANPDYFAGSPKGRPIARRVTYRAVPEGGTRVADLRSGTADLVRDVPVDQVAALRDEAAVIATPLAGSAWVRIATDVAPFADVRVRQALNYAVDVDAIAEALLGGQGRRLASFFPAGGLGDDPSLAPYPYDPDRARALLREAGLPDGFGTELEYASASGVDDVVAAVADQLTAVGVRTAVRSRDLATFNQGWTDRQAPPLRFATWRPLFDPYVLLSLVVARGGFLSRHDNPRAQPLLDAAARETDEARRAQRYRELAKVLHDEPAAIYLYGLTARYGVGDRVPSWTPRPDDYLIATTRAAG